jgi:hypothetical protein
MPRACVLQHIRCEPPGLFTGLPDDRGFAVETVELDEGGALPDWRETGLVLAMGGPMGAYDETAHPWLAAYQKSAEAVLGAGGFRQLAAAFAAARDSMALTAAQMFTAWLDLAAAARPAGRA